MAFVFTWWFTKKKAFSDFDPDNYDSVAKMNKRAKLFQNITLGTAILNGAACAAIIQTSTDIVKENTGILLEGGKQIGQEMYHLANLTSEITGSMNEMAAGSNQITKAVEICRNLTNDNLTNFNSLRAEVGKFKTK